jgi:hypothetical protein
MSSSNHSDYYCDGIWGVESCASRSRGIKASITSDFKETNMSMVTVEMKEDTQYVKHFAN